MGVIGAGRGGTRVAVAAVAVLLAVALPVGRVAADEVTPDDVVAGQVVTDQVAAVDVAPEQVSADTADATADERAGTGEFRAPLRIDSEYFPLVAGTQFVYDGVVTDDEGVHAHRVIFTVTDLIKTIDGLNTRVIWDRDLSEDGELAEAELSFFAQDRADNVWTIGEYPEEYEDGSTSAPNTWISGVAKARSGVLVPGSPRVGTPEFEQGVAPVVDFYDVGKVVKMGQVVCVPAGCYKHVVVVDEYSPLAPEDGHQQKYYAPGVGLIKIDANSGDSQEVMTLTRIVHLGWNGISEARTEAMRLDTRAYKLAWVYRRTEPAHRWRDGDDD